MRLVEVLDELLDLLEADESFSKFLLDGQMAVVDDYLEIRPENLDRLRALALKGRLAMGPWYILMDEFLVSGETILRNLQLGIARGEHFGGVMEVGYLPDMFGHIAQMPQLLSLADFQDAVLWRGVPSAISEAGFDWESPDGSVIRTEYLAFGYGNGSLLPNDPEALLRRLKELVADGNDMFSDAVLIMNGSDHLPAQPFLGELVETLNATQTEFSLSICSLPDYLATVPRQGLTRWKGELRSGARANVLMGVLSNRVDVKKAAAQTERLLERSAEPLAALFLPPRDYPTAFFDLAWKLVIQNSAHDSICACSVDDVVNAVLERYAEAQQLGSGIHERSLRSLATSFAAAGTYVINSTARRRAGLVETVISGDGIDEDLIQVLSEQAGLPGSLVLDANTVKTVLGMLDGPKINDDVWVSGVRLTDDDQGVHLTITLGTEENPELDIPSAKEELTSLLTERPDAAVFVNLDQPRIRRVLTRVAPVPGFGWAPLTPAPLSNPAHCAEDDSLRLSNGLIDVAIDAISGCFAINGIEGFGRLVDEGDLGDSYNYSPPARDQRIDSPKSVVVSVDERGPVRASAVITATYTWPDHIDGGSQQRIGSHDVVVTTRLELNADEPLVRVETSFQNPSKDHRLRVHLPLPEPTSTSHAECAFAVISRGLEAEGRPDEFGLPTFPSRRFVQAGGLTVVHEGLHEYELIDIQDGEAHTLAVTLLRSTGMLSRLGLTNRPFPAGPLTAVEGLQLLGETIHARYAIAFGECNPYQLADEVFTPLETVTSFGGGQRQLGGTALTVLGGEVSSLRRRDGHLEVRLFNPQPEPVTVHLPGTAGEIVNLRDRVIDTFSEDVPLGPFKVVTLRLSDSPR